MLKDYTIANIITPLIECGIGIIRISGNEAFMIIDKIFKAYSSTYLKKESHKVYLGTIHNENGDKLDEVLVLLMRGPNSFTGEDTVEIHCHGNPFILQEAMKVILKNGARKSEAGEFTRRAFLNGKLDLTQSEAILDTITANNQKALTISLNQLEGSLKNKIGALKEDLIGIIAYLEATIDFPDDEIEESYTNDVINTRIEKLLDEINKLLASYNTGRIIKEGIMTVMIGRPNVGKSSLLNSLLNENRAIITHLPGTTRDAIEEQINIGDLVLNIVDTAGFRETEDIIEKIGIKKTYEYIDIAQLIIFLVDATLGLTVEDQLMLEYLRKLEKNYIIVMNKVDLINIEDIETSDDIIFISAKHRTGLDNLKNDIKKLFIKDEIEDYCISNLRYYESLVKAKSALDMFQESIKSQIVPADLLAIDLKDAYIALATITGDDFTEDLLDNIFSKFCIGK
ncbi:MAG: tRNA modification GTPase TrmE [Fusobacteria bacterium]|nr:MAG: tRNA modification GTPase TrmE [Fusobacteriota bacterium]KAF0228915.1 MAG: tRNA modification GTPase [Fusobacteriota bacterium]